MLPVTVAERSKACTVFARSEAGSLIRIPLRAWMFSVCVCVCVCVCAFLCVCVQVEALRRAESPAQGVLTTAYRIKKKRPSSYKRTVVR
jgi:hypothetical protein